jgi:hypothetical protein
MNGSLQPGVGCTSQQSFTTPQSLGQVTAVSPLLQIPSPQYSPVVQLPQPSDSTSLAQRLSQLKVQQNESTAQTHASTGPTVQPGVGCASQQSPIPVKQSAGHEAEVSPPLQQPSPHEAPQSETQLQLSSEPPQQPSPQKVAPQSA